MKKSLWLAAAFLAICVPLMIMGHIAAAQLDAITTETPFYQVDPNATCMQIPRRES